MVTQTDVMQDLSFLLGESTIPTTGTEDRQRFIQKTLERVYRAYPFDMNRVTATLQMTNGIGTLATNVRQDGVVDVREVLPGSDNDRIYYQIPYEDQDNFTEGAYKYWLTGYEGAYQINTTEKSTSPILTVRHETTAPVINASIATPFPSSICLALGALVYFRIAEDPQADISQEEAKFKQELDEVIASFNRSRQTRGKTLYEINKTYVGDIY